MQELIIIGNLTKDPVSRTTATGKTVCDISVAVNRRKKADGTQEADFFRCSVWGQTGEACQKYLSKGNKVCVTGTVSVSTYTGQDGQTRASMDVFAKDVEFLSKRGDAGQSNTNAGMTDVSGDVQGELPF